jgi:hypothetical protein
MPLPSSVTMPGVGAGELVSHSRPRRAAAPPTAIPLPKDRRWRRPGGSRVGVLPARPRFYRNMVYEA